MFKWMKKGENPKPQKIKLPKNSVIKAIIYFSNNKYDVVTIKNISDFFFSHKGKSYVLDFDGVMTFKKGNIITKTELFLFYYYDSDQPLRVDEKLSNITTKRIPNDVLHTALQSDAIKKANDIKNGNFLDDLFNNPVLMIGLVVAAGIAIFMISSGGI